MTDAVSIEGGFAEVGAGTWLMGRGQPAAFLGKAVRRPRRGWCVRDRARLDLVETTSSARCADRSRPFLTHIPCAAPVSAVSSKVLVAPAASRTGARLVKIVPMSFQRSVCVTEFGAEWVVMSTKGRTARVQVPEGDTLSVRPDAVVAWTGPRPSGFCPRLGILDVLLPRSPRDLLFSFHGPCVVWIEGTEARQGAQLSGRRPV